MLSNASALRDLFRRTAQLTLRVKSLGASLPQNAGFFRLADQVGVTRPVRTSAPRGGTTHEGQ